MLMSMRISIIIIMIYIKNVCIVKVRVSRGISDITTRLITIIIIQKVRYVL